MVIEKIGIIGLGFMGRPIAENLIRKGYMLTIFARIEQVKAEMKALGAKVVQSPKSLAEQTDIIFLVVTDSKAVRQLLFGPDGLVKGASAGMIIVDMTTSDPLSSRRLAKRLKKKRSNILMRPYPVAPYRQGMPSFSSWSGGRKKSMKDVLRFSKP